jgi:hypothetical protein
MSDFEVAAGMVVMAEVAVAVAGFGTKTAVVLVA